MLVWYSPLSVTYETKKLFIALFLLVYLCGGLYERFVHEGHETYPFFSWYLFASIPNPTDDAFTIHILSIGDTVYTPPLPFSKSGPFITTLMQSPTEYTPVIEVLGRAVLGRDMRTAAIARKRLEEMFGGKSARYELLQVAYDPVQLWKTGEYASSTVLSVFDTRK